MGWTRGISTQLCLQPAGKWRPALAIDLGSTAGTAGAAMPWLHRLLEAPW
jgi:hypothetical protein